MTAPTPPANPEPDLSWLDELLDGIDRDDGKGGWWETSTGAEFGAGKLAQLKDEITRRFYQPCTSSRPAATVDAAKARVDAAQRIADLAVRMMSAELDVQTERDRADRWRAEGNKFYDVRGWLRLCEDTPEGHAEFYREISAIVFPDHTPEPLAPVEAAAARVVAAQAALQAVIDADSSALRDGA